jgi:hypothetical protein
MYIIEARNFHEHLIGSNTHFNVGNLSVGTNGSHDGRSFLLDQHVALHKHDCLQQGTNGGQTHRHVLLRLRHGFHQHFENGVGLRPQRLRLDGLANVSKSHQRRLAHQRIVGRGGSRVAEQINALGPLTRRNLCQPDRSNGLRRSATNLLHRRAKSIHASHLSWSKQRVRFVCLFCCSLSLLL